MKYIPGGVLDPAQYSHELDAPEARYKLARAVLQEIPRQVYILNSYLRNIYDKSLYQVVEYMKKKGIAPKLASIPDF